MFILSRELKQINLYWPVLTGWFIPSRIICCVPQGCANFVLCFCFVKERVRGSLGQWLNSLTCSNGACLFALLRATVLFGGFVPFAGGGKRMLGRRFMLQSEPVMDTLALRIHKDVIMVRPQAP